MEELLLCRLLSAAGAHAAPAKGCTLGVEGEGRQPSSVRPWAMDFLREPVTGNRTHSNTPG